MKNLFKKIAKLNSFFTFLAIEFLYIIKHDMTKETKIYKEIEKFVPQQKKADKSFMKKVYKDLLYLKCICEISFIDEYFTFRLYEKDRKAWQEYVFTDEYLKKSKKIEELEKDDDHILADKYKGYLTLKPYYKRDVIKLEDFADYPIFEAFVKKHPVFLLKKKCGSLGKNIIKYDANEVNIRNLFMTAISKEQWVAEEIVEQDEIMASLHPQSLNTVRIATYRKNGNITKIFAMFRMGSGGSVVDNASNGGICASVDLNTGVIESIGYKKNGDVVEIHPDTNIAIKGFQIPKWDELMALCDEVATNVPIYKYVGWDFALSKNDGWVIVEGNSRPNINSIQMCSGRGLRKAIEIIFE